MKLYLRPKLTKELTFYNTIEYIKPARINKPTPPLQETAPQLILKRGQGHLYKYLLLTAIEDIIIYLRDDAT